MPACYLPHLASGCMCNDSVRERACLVMARVRLRLTARYAAVPRCAPGGILHRAGHFGAATLFGARSVRFASTAEKQDAEERDAALVQTRRAAYVARLWADRSVTWH